MRRKAALELSIGTIVVIVIGITMLILGIVFVRSIMCGALGLTGELNDRVVGEINALFGSTGAEVQCIGSGEAVKMIPGEVNYIWCGFKAPQEAKYSIELTDYQGVYSSKSDIKGWIVDDSAWQGTVAPGDNDPKKILRLNIPENAPEDTITFDITIKKDSGNGMKLIKTYTLDFKVSRVGMFRAAMC